MLEESIAVRTVELALLGDNADQGHIDRAANEIATLARCKECDKEKPEPPRDVPVYVPDWKKWLERNRTPVLVTGVVVGVAVAIALTPVTGGGSLAALGAL